MDYMSAIEFVRNNITYVIVFLCPKNSQITLVESRLHAGTGHHSE